MDPEPTDSRHLAMLSVFTQQRLLRGMCDAVGAQPFLLQMVPPAIRESLTVLSCPEHRECLVELLRTPTLDDDLRDLIIRVVAFLSTLCSGIRSGGWAERIAAVLLTSRLSGMLQLHRKRDPAANLIEACSLADHLERTLQFLYEA